MQEPIHKLRAKENKIKFTSKYKHIPKPPQIWEQTISGKSSLTWLVLEAHGFHYAVFTAADLHIQRTEKFCSNLY